MTHTPTDEDGRHSVILAIVISALAIAAFLFPMPNSHEQPEPKKKVLHPKLIETAYADEGRVVRIATTTTPEPEPEVPTLHPELKVICSCESDNIHREADGSLLSGRVDSRDKGECQINTYYHLDTMESMGLDINDDVDYYTYANHLFETQGRQPWSASAACWAPIIGYQ